MSRLLCCLCVRRSDMGAALSLPQEGDACEAGAGAGGVVAPPTMADVIRERKKKAGGAALGTLRRRLAAAARRPRDPRDQRPDRGCEHARFIRSVVSSWRLAEVFLLCEELEAGAALRDLATQAELAREPARALHQDLATKYRDRWWCDVELVGAGWSIPAHRAILSARCTYFRDLLQRYPSSTCRVPLEGACAGLSREEVEACVCALYAGPSLCARRPLCSTCAKWERGVGSENDLDIINVDNIATYRSVSLCGCGRARVEAGSVRRLGALLGFSLDSLHRDMRYLLDSGEYADSRLVFRLEGGCGAQYGFRSALELPCHRVILAARSRFFRSVMSRRTSGGAGGAGGGGGGGAGAGGAVCVDEKVLPRRFARALLHAAYTDQVDLTLIGRSAAAPGAAAGGGGGGGAGSVGGATAWAGVSRGGAGGGGGASTAHLDDAFQLYEIARFLEMPIVVQGCEDAVVEALSADTLPHVLRWASAPHASHWVHRQAMRYLRDEFPAIMSQAASARLPRAALADALASPFLQASEAQALRALVRWGERSALTKHAADQREPNVVWHTAHSVSRRGARRREVSDAALREQLASLVCEVRLEHLPADNELLQQAVRRGLVPAPPAPPPPPLAEEGEGCAADAWLGRGTYRPPRCFLPYLDEIKALLEDQAVPEAEVSRARRARYLHRIPDTLYMVAAARGGVGAGSGAGGGAECGADARARSTESACVSPRVLGALRARVRELRAAPPAARALALHAADTTTVYRQIALRAVRERSLPDACADLLLAGAGAGAGDERERGSGEWESPRLEPHRGEAPWAEADRASDCCRSGGGSVRCASAGSLRSARSLHIPLEKSRGACRRELPARPGPADAALHRQSMSELSGVSGAGGVAVGVAGVGAGACRAALSAAVPDVAMAPNANTHLLTARDYFRHSSEFGGAGMAGLGVGAGMAGVSVGAGAGGVLQLDLGDGATHTPRPGSRAGRAAASHAHAERARERVRRDLHQSAACAQAGGGAACARPRPDEEELRAALELSVIRAYSSFHPAGAPPAGAAGVSAGAGRGRALAGAGGGAALTLPHCFRTDLTAFHPLPGARRGTPSPSPGAHAHAHVTHTPTHLAAGRRGAAGPGAEPLVSASRSPSPSPGASPRRARREYPLYRHHDYRLEPSYGSSGSNSRGPSPNNYA